MAYKIEVGSEVWLRLYGSVPCQCCGSKKDVSSETYGFPCCARCEADAK